MAPFSATLKKVFVVICGVTPGGFLPSIDSSIQLHPLRINMGQWFSYPEKEMVEAVKDVFFFFTGVYCVCVHAREQSHRYEEVSLSDQWAAPQFIFEHSAGCPHRGPCLRQK